MDLEIKNMYYSFPSSNLAYRVQLHVSVVPRFASFKHFHQDSAGLCSLGTTDRVSKGTRPHFCNSSEGRLIGSDCKVTEATDKMQSGLHSLMTHIKIFAEFIPIIPESFDAVRELL